MESKRSIAKEKNKELKLSSFRYAERLGLKNGPDLKEGEDPPVTGRKREMLRAYELLVLKTDKEFEDDAKFAEERRRENRRRRRGANDLNAKPAGMSASRETPEDRTYRSYVEDEGFVVMSQKELHQRRRRRMLTVLGVVIAVLAVIDLRLLFGPPLMTADISTYKDVGIEIEGLTDEPFTVSAGELSKLKRTTLQVEVHQGEVAPGTEPERGRAIGPELGDFISHYSSGKTLSDFRSMKVYTEKGDSNAYVRTLYEKKIVLSIANGNKPLGEKQAPLRIAVEDTDPSEWTGWVRKIVFTPY